MLKYSPLTKIITDKGGKENIACQFYGTEKCRDINIVSGCMNCPMMSAILNQLHIFEKIYMENEPPGG